MIRIFYFSNDIQFHFMRIFSVRFREIKEKGDSGSEEIIWSLRII